MTPEINADKWYQRWWSWTPEQIIGHKHEPHVVERLVRLANNRCVVGFYRYELPRFGRATKVDGREWDLPGRMIEKLQRYQQTGNTELLVDVFNYVRWEFARPGHPDAHFKAEDQGVVNDRLQERHTGS